MATNSLFRIKKHLFFLIIFILFVLVWPRQVSATSLSLVSKTENIIVESEFQVDIILDAQDEETLGADVVILYDPLRLEALRIKPGNLYPNYPEAGQRIGGYYRYILLEEASSLQVLAGKPSQLPIHATGSMIFLPPPTTVSAEEAIDLVINNLLGRFHGLYNSSFNQLPDDKWFIKLCCHILWQSALMQLQFRTNNDHRTS